MKNFNAIIVCFILVLGATSIVAAQQPDFLFENPYPYKFTHTVFLEERVEVVHMEIAPDGDSEGCYFVAASDDKSHSYYESDSMAYMPMVYKVSRGGEILGELALGYEDRYSMVNRLFEDPEGNLISYSATGQGEMGFENDSIKAIQGSTCMDLVGEDSF